MNSHREPDPPEDESKPEIRRDSPAAHVAGMTDYGIERLRELLLDTEQKELVELRDRLDDPDVRVSELVPLLPEVVRRAARDADLNTASQPVIEQSLRQSVRDDPRVLSEILFPVIGPAVWKAISRAFRDLTDSLNKTMERNLTLTGFRWRWESFRTGRPVAEVALRSSLVYRVEQVYLIDAESGIPIQYAGPESGTRDSEMMSGMLTAIQDFVRDSFSVDASQELDTLRVGDFLVWIVRGPRAFLAAVIQGSSPGPELREALRSNLRLIHRSLNSDSRASATDLSTLRPFLEACLKEEVVSGPQQKSRVGYVMLSIVVLGAAVWFALGWLEGRRQADLVQRLAVEPGIAVIDSGQVDGEFRISGLRDPLARAPGILVAEAGLDAEGIRFDFSPYLSLEREVVLRRAVAELDPPDSVSLDFANGTLRATGSAGLAWLARLRADGARIPGVDSIEAGQTGFTDPSWEELRGEIERHVVPFGVGAAVASAPDEQALAGLVVPINDAVGMLRSAGFDGVVDVFGITDTTGPEELNRALAQRRAEWVRDRLIGSGVGSGSLQTIAAPEGRDSASGSDRSVRFEVRVLGDSVGPVP